METRPSEWSWEMPELESEPIWLEPKCSCFLEHSCTFTHGSEQAVGREGGREEGRTQLRLREGTARCRLGKPWLVHICCQHVAGAP